MNKAGLPAPVCLLAEACTHAQNGRVQVAASFLIFNNQNNYWFADTNNGDSHLQYVPGADFRVGGLVLHLLPSMKENESLVNK